jgi:4-hydroxy-3-methylbut-2-enyl diphosphate reductase
MIDVEIDKKSGFCFGVVYAINKVEESLKNGEKIYCIGDIVHNNEEVKRLESIGLSSIDHDELKKLKNATVLIRAHGEPPETYKIALHNNLKLIDASCPVVLKLQSKIKTGFEKVNAIDGQLVIFGKEGHAEVNGLVGQTKNKAIVIGNINDIDKIDFTKDIYLYSQTTKNLDDFKILVEKIKERALKNGVNFVSNDTICRQVSNREADLKVFCSEKDVIIFVSGKKSSNGKVLFETCRSQNPRTYNISSINEIDKNWFTNIKSVGICGATSTPLWLMENVKKHIENL